MQKGKTKGRVSDTDSVLSLMRGTTLVTYDREADAAYFKLKKAKIAKTLELQDWLFADVDKKGALVGIEMLFVSDRIPRRNIPSALQAGTIPIAV